jgi:hypothetical protein
LHSHHRLDSCYVVHNDCCFEQIDQTKKNRYRGFLERNYLPGYSGDGAALGSSTFHRQVGEEGKERDKFFRRTPEEQLFEEVGRTGWQCAVHKGKVVPFDALWLFKTDHFPSRNTKVEELLTSVVAGNLH